MSIKKSALCIQLLSIFSLFSAVASLPPTPLEEEFALIKKALETCWKTLDTSNQAAKDTAAGALDALSAVARTYKDTVAHATAYTAASSQLEELNTRLKATVASREALQAELSRTQAEIHVLTVTIQDKTKELEKVQGENAALRGQLAILQARGV